MQRQPCCCGQSPQCRSLPSRGRRSAGLVRQLVTNELQAQQDDTQHACFATVAAWLSASPKGVASLTGFATRLICLLESLPTQQEFHVILAPLGL